MIETEVETYTSFFLMQKEMDMSKDHDSFALDWLSQLKDWLSFQLSRKIGKQGHLLLDPWDNSVPFHPGIAEIS